jgi:multiple sugar transport system ATP-binding protein
MTLADRIVVLKDGRIEQQGSPLDLFERPQTRFVAGFIGSPQMNFVPVEVDSDGSALKLEDGTQLPITAGRVDNLTQRQLTLGVRPTQIAPARGDVSRAGHVRRMVRVDLIQPTGARSFVTFMLGKTPVTAEVGAHDVSAVSEEMAVEIDLARAILLDPGTGMVV